MNSNSCQSFNHIYSMTAEFQAAMLASGIGIGGLPVADGQIHRFHIKGDKAGSRNGWYILHGDGLPAGSYGSWKTGDTFRWCAKPLERLTKQEREANRQRIAQAEQLRAAEQQKVWSETAVKCAELWEKAARNVTADHDYLNAKNVRAYGLRQLRDMLLVPARDPAGALVSVQFIKPDGSKRFKTGGRIQGCYHSINQLTDRLYICEGYATGATIHEATGCGVVVAFNAGNLKAVAETIKAKYPDREVVIAADNDRHTEGNPGLTKGQEAAQALSLSMVFPTFEEGRTGSDFNDYVALYGQDATKKALNPAVNCPPLEEHPVKASIQWRPPIPFTDNLLPVESFELDLLPERLRLWVQDISERKDNAPADFAAVGVMCALGALLGRKIGIHPKAYDDWLVIPNIWGVVIGRPSMKKTPTLEDAIKPLKRLEADAKATYEEEEKQHKVALELDRLQSEEAKRKAKQKIKNGDHGAAAMLLEDAAENAPGKPVRRRHIINNATVEKLGEILAENPMGVLQYRDELTGWLNSMDRDDRGEDRAFYLEAWNGTGRFTYDRIGRGTVDMESTTVSVLGGIQPGKLRPYLIAQKEGHGDDGFMERLQLMVYPDQCIFKHVDRWPDMEAKNRAYEVFGLFADIPPSEGDIPALRFTPEAQGIFNEWYTELMARVRGEEISPQLESHLSKYPSLMPSIALIIHVAEKGPQGAVGIEDAVKAVAWCEYLESHARRVYALASDPCFGARALLQRLPDLPNPFTKKDFNRKGWAGLTNAEEIQQALNILCDRGYLHLETEQTSTKPKAVYYINPAVLEV